MKNKKELVIYVIVALILLSITFGISYAYFIATVTGNNSATETRITAGILDIKFNISDNINNTNIMLVKDENRYKKAETIDFTVSNNGRGNIDGVYYIYLTDLTISNNLKSPDFKWELIKNNNIVFSGNFVNAQTDNDFTLTQVDNNDIKQTITVGSTDTYKLRIWLSETQEDQTNLLEGEFSAKIRVISSQLTSNDIPTAPEPELYQGLIPVIYDSNGKTIVANTNSTWYDYDNHMWANAVLGTASARTKTAGQELTDEEILQYYVWIPRYRYQLFNAVAGESADEQMINIEFENIYKSKSNGTNNGEWLTHPAFTFGNTELNGLWVGKFEPSHSNISEYIDQSTANKLGCSNENCVSANGLIIKPNKISIVYNNISNEFYASRSIENSSSFGLDSSEVDTHMMKNMEWGAVAYLSSSKYGLYTSENTCYNSDNNKLVTINGKSVNRCEIWINNTHTGTGCGTNDNWTVSACGGTITGCSALLNLDDNVRNNMTNCGNTQYEWNGLTNNGRSSTSGNIYGIYDMSGGGWEHTMGNQSSSTDEYIWNSYSALFDIINKPSTRYYDKYLASVYNTSELTERRDQGRGLLGDATREVLKIYGTDYGGWFGDRIIFISRPDPWFVRGGYAFSGASSGIYEAYRHTGGDVVFCTFRVVLTAEDK